MQKGVRATDNADTQSTTSFSVRLPTAQGHTVSSTEGRLGRIPKSPTTGYSALTLPLHSESSLEVQMGWGSPRGSSRWERTF